MCTSLWPVSPTKRMTIFASTIKQQERDLDIGLIIDIVSLESWKLRTLLQVRGDPQDFPFSTSVLQKIEFCIQKLVFKPFTLLRMIKIARAAGESVSMCSCKNTSLCSCRLWITSTANFTVTMLRPMPLYRYMRFASFSEAAATAILFLFPCNS